MRAIQKVIHFLEFKKIALAAAWSSGTVSACHPGGKFHTQARNVTPTYVGLKLQIYLGKNIHTLVTYDKINDKLFLCCRPFPNLLSRDQDK
jgi:hypothetical protein